MKTLSTDEIEILTQKESQVQEPQEFYEPISQPPNYPKLPVMPIPNEKPKKNRTWILIGVTIFLSLILIANFIWFNYSFSNGKARDNSTTINNIDVPDIPVTIDDKDTNNYEHSITNQIIVDISEADKKDIANDIVNKILEELNESS